MEYDKMAQGTIASLGGNTPVVLPYAPTRIRIFNATRAGAAAGVVSANWDSEMGQGAAMLTTLTTYGTTPSVVADLTSYITAATGGGFYTFQAGLSLQYGPSLNILTVTKNAGAPIVTTSANHNLVSGNVVIMQGLVQTTTTGMQQLVNIPFVVTVTAPTTFTLAIDNSGAMFTAYNNGSAIVQATVKQVLYPRLYYPGTYDIVAIALGATTVVTTSQPHNMVLGQEVAFRIPSVYGTTQLNSLPNVLIPGSPVYGFVTVVNSATQVTVNINSTGYTAFTFPTVAQNIGVAPAQIVAVGDNNTGAFPVGTAFPPPTTINGPCIAGAYVNNTAQGFVIGASVAGTAADVIYWEADYASIT